MTIVSTCPHNLLLDVNVSVFRFLFLFFNLVILLKSLYLLLLQNWVCVLATVIKEYFKQLLNDKKIVFWYSKKVLKVFSFLILCQLNKFVWHLISKLFYMLEKSAIHFPILGMGKREKFMRLRFGPKQHKLMEF